ncbi:amidase signature domain-containing protein [Panaeolus papilionaceus]|nr:amidase signature domain-containing protein [Panaeolus papilionaceus]
MSSLIDVKLYAPQIEKLPLAANTSTLREDPKRRQYHGSIFRLLVFVVAFLTGVVILLPIGLREGLFLSLWAPSYHLPDLYEASVLELQHGMDSGHFTSVDLVKAYLSRIEEVNPKGAELRAVIETNPSAISQAAVLDRERRRKGKRSLLHGIPVLVKDNIATLASEGMNTTAGSFALLGSVVPGDAGVIKRLRRAGAIVLGKTNLSEFSQVRGTVPLGWSGRGGQCTNAYFKNGNPCGSSSGSGVAASIGLAAVTLGSETDGSITCPSSFNNVVGVKPTLGLTSRAGVIPISEHQDTIGPITRSVSDAAIVLNFIAGKDLDDKATLLQPPTRLDYTQALREDALKGKRIGVPRRAFLDSNMGGATRPAVLEAFEKAIVTMSDLGATIIDPADMPGASELNNDTRRGEAMVLGIDLKDQLNDYLKKLTRRPEGVNSLADIIKFNNDHPELEMPEGHESQDFLITAEATSGRNATFAEALEENQILGRSRGIDAALQAHNLDALILPLVDTARTTTPSALAGYPIVTVPLGFFPMDTKAVLLDTQTFYPAPGLPFGLQFMGAAYTEFDLIGFAYAYEQRTKTRLQRKAIPAAIPKTQLKDIINLRKAIH